MYTEYKNRGDVLLNIGETLSEYYNVKVRVLNNSLFHKNKIGDIYCYPFYKIMFSLMHSKEIDDFIKREFCGDLRDWKYMVRFSYNILMNILGSKGAKFVLCFEKPIMNADKLMILSTNKKIKIVDFKRNEIINVLKAGYSDEWFKKEVDIRSRQQGKYILPLKQTDPGVYTEKFIYGQTFSRISRERRHGLIPEVLSCLEYITGFDFKIKTPAEYLIELNNEFENLIKKTSGKVDKTQINKLNMLVKIYNKAVLSSPTDIPVAMSHGDVQNGNVIIETETGKLWLVDWETWGRRCIYYDKMTFLLNLRNKAIQDIKLNAFISGRGEGILNKKYNLNTVEQAKAIAAVYLFEDLLFQLEETSVLPADSTSEAIGYYISSDTGKVADMII